MSNEVKPTGRSLADRIVKATVAIAAAHAMAKAFGLVQARVIGHYYGFGDTGDAFFLVFDGLIMMLFMVGEESLLPASLPCFVEAKEKDSEEAAWRFVSTLLNLQVLLLLCAVALLMLFPQQAIELFSRFKASEDGGASRMELAAYFLKGMAPALVGLSVGSLTYMVLNGYKIFFWAAFADAALKAALVGGILFGRQFGLSDDALVVGVLAAGVTKIVVHLLALSPKLRLWRPHIALSDPNFRRFLLLVIPLIAGILFAKARDFFNQFYVISELGTGLVSTHTFGRKIFSAIHFLIPYPLSIALFPFFCEMVDRGDRASLGDALTRSSRMLLLMFLPLTVVLCVISIPMAQALFQTGKVTEADAVRSGLVNMCYLAALPFQSLECVFMQAYFSTRRMWSVTLIGILFSSLSIMVSYIGVLVYGLRGMDAVMLVALGWSGSRALKLIALIGLLKWQGMPVLQIGPTAGFLLRAAMVMLICGGSAYGVRIGVERFMSSEPAMIEKAPAETDLGKKAVAPPKDMEEKEDQTNKSKKPRVSGKEALIRAMPRLALPSIVAFILFFPACKLLRLKELDEILAFAKEKLRRKKGGKPPAEEASS